MKRIAMFILLLLSAAIFTAARAAAATKITACQEITNPGSYVVANNLDASSVPANVPCLTINADEVAINLNGFIIDCGGSAGVDGIESGRTAVSISNGTIRSCAAGISLSGGLSRVSGVRVLNNGVGIQAGSKSIVGSCQVTGSSGNGLVVMCPSLVSGNVLEGNNNTGFGFFDLEETGSGCVNTNNVVGTSNF